MCRQFREPRVSVAICWLRLYVARPTSRTHSSGGGSVRSRRQHASAARARWELSDIGTCSALVPLDVGLRTRLSGFALAYCLAPSPIATDASLGAPFVGVRQPLLLRPSPPVCGPLATRCRDAQSARHCGRVPPRHRKRPGSRLSPRSGHFFGGSERSVSASSFERPS